MPIDEVTNPQLISRIVDTGKNNNYPITEVRYFKVTNIASILGTIYNLIWMVISLGITEAPKIYLSNAVLGVLFLITLFLNYNGWQMVATVWLNAVSFISVLIFLYLLGYSSGIAFVLLLTIILPYMTFPRRARKLAHGFSVLSCLTLIFSVLLQSNIAAYYDKVDPYLLQIVNISITGLICLALIWRMSSLIDQSELSILAEQQKSDDLLHNILPVDVARDLKETGKTVPRRYENVTIMFTDFKGFTELVASISETTLVKELNEIFGRFDEITIQTGVEKIETIGDAYVAASGLGGGTTKHALNCITAAQQMLNYLDERNNEHEIQWKMRVGIHSGPIVAGVVGKKKFRYDLFGDTINTASRMESSGEPGEINISRSTYQLIKNEFNCDYRGKINVKGKGDMEMYFIK